MKAWIILEWMGAWKVPDSDHGGVSPGPFESERVASQVLERFIRIESGKWAELAGRDAAERESRILWRRHAIVSVDLPVPPAGDGLEP